MLDLRKKIFIISGVVVLVLISIILFYLFVYKQNLVIPSVDDASYDNQLVDENQINNLGSSTGAVNLLPTKQAPVVGNPDEFYAEQVAKIFVERFFTYSNQNNNQHIADILPLLTNSMTKWANRQTVVADSDYKGLTTLVVASRNEGAVNDGITVFVDVQQIVSSATGNETEYKSGRVELSKIDNDWKVNGFYWD